MLKTLFSFFCDLEYYDVDRFGTAIINRFLLGSLSVKSPFLIKELKKLEDWQKEAILQRYGRESVDKAKISLKIAERIEWENDFYLNYLIFRFKEWGVYPEKK